MTQAKTQKIIEQSLEATRKARDVWIKTTSKASKAFATQYDAMFYGQKELAEKLGFDCACVEKSTTKVPQGVYCGCIPRLRERKTTKLSGVFTFDGEGCRDGEGRFVPISRCKGPVGRDKAGRFVSIKGAA